MTARSHRPGSVIVARIMLLILACTLAAVAAAPHYDQRQDGESNILADIQNIVIVVGYPKNFPASEYLSVLLRENAKRSGEIPIAQDRSDVHPMKAFVEPNKPYQVVIGDEKEKSAEDTAIVISGRRRSDIEPSSDEEMKLIGATEQCGPGRKRDPVTLICQNDEIPEEPTPEVTVIQT